eukprot:6822312-Pyramimonas_sp.AAC.1
MQTLVSLAGSDKSDSPDYDAPRSRSRSPALPKPRAPDELSATKANIMARIAAAAAANQLGEVRYLLEQAYKASEAEAPCKDGSA